MTGNQENKYSMFLAVQQVCNLFNTVWAGVAAFATAFASFEAGIGNINSTRLKQEKDLKGIAEDKKVKEDDMINKTLGLIGPLVAYANVTLNEPLRQEIDFSERELILSRDTILENKCQIVQDRANTHSADLIASYGVTALQITEQNTSITEFHPTIAGPRSAIALRKTQTAELELLINSTNAILTEQLDKLVVVFQSTKPQFVTDYNNSRIIVDLGGGKNTWSGTVADGLTKNIMSTATNDAQIWELTNAGTGDLQFGRGANSSDMGIPVTVPAGTTITKTAIELGNTGNKFMNVKNESGSEGSYKIVRI